MAVIQHVDPSTHAIGFDGVEYPTKGEGLFEVPHEVATALVKFPHFRLYDGLPWPHEKTKEEVEAERIAGLVRSAMQASAPAEPAKKPDRLAAARAALKAKAGRGATTGKK